MGAVAGGREAVFVVEHAANSSIVQELRINRFMAFIARALLPIFGGFQRGARSESAASGNPGMAPVNGEVLLDNLVIVPAVLFANHSNVLVPGGFRRRNAVNKAVDGQIAKRLPGMALNGMESFGRNADYVSGGYLVMFSGRTDGQKPLSLDYEEDLLGVFVLVQRRSFSRGENDHENLGGGAIRAVDDQIGSVGGEPIGLFRAGVVDVFHKLGRVGYLLWSIEKAINLTVE